MTETIGEHQRERLLRLLAVATFVVFFQAYMVAPIIPALSSTFEATVQTVGFLVPAYLIPYGVATLLYGLLADRFGVHRVMFLSLVAFAVLTVLTATAQSIEQLMLWRALTGLGASGVVPLALALVGRLFPYELRGRPLGWLFGAMAGGMAFGSPLGAVLVPVIGWRGLFVVVGVAGVGLLLVLLPYRTMIAGAIQGSLARCAISSAATGSSSRRRAGAERIALFWSIRCSILASSPGSASISSNETGWVPSASALRFWAMACRASCLVR